MDKQDKINDLFRTAREQEPKTSFDETKERFLKSLDQFPTDGKPKNVSFFNFKKWRIMLSSIIIIASITVALFNTGNVKTENKMKSTSKMEVKEKVKVKSINTNNSTKNNSETTLKKPEILFSLSGNSLTPNNYFNEIISLGPVRNKYQQIPIDDTLKKEVLLFPKLSAKDIKKNNLRKKEMLKQVDRIRKGSSRYSYISAGSFDFLEKKISVQAFFMSNTEITNLEYRTFLYDLLIQNKKEEYLKAKPDDSVWGKMFGKGMESMNIYSTHPSFDNFPVLNISREGAEMYCLWLTQEVHKVENPDKNGFNNLGYNDFRIPMREEWIYAATSKGKHYTYPWGSESVKNTSDCYLANHKPFPNSFHDDGGFHTVQVLSYNPNDLGLYNICGNVAEMVYDYEYGQPGKPGKIDKTKVGTAGGGWMDSADEIKILAQDKYKGIIEAHPNIGFRIVMTHIGSNTKKLLIK